MKLEARARLAAESYPAYLDRLQDLKIKKLGEGAKATVFQHPVYKNVVVKVVARDTRYMKYLHFASAHSHNRFVPRIADIVETPTDNTAQSYTVFLEKLGPASLAAQRAVLRKDFLPHLGKVYTSNGKEVLFRDFVDLDQAQWRKLSTAPDKDVAEISTFLSKFNDDHLDLWPSNFRMRGSQLIFSDPVA